jgi:hypothetical protein
MTRARSAKPGSAACRSRSANWNPGESCEGSRPGSPDPYILPTAPCLILRPHFSLVSHLKRPQSATADFGAPCSADRERVQIPPEDLCQGSPSERQRPTGSREGTGKGPRPTLARREREGEAAARGARRTQRGQPGTGARPGRGAGGPRSPGRAPGSWHAVARRRGPAGDGRVPTQWAVAQDPLRGYPLRGPRFSRPAGSATWSGMLQQTDNLQGNKTRWPKPPQRWIWGCPSLPGKHRKARMKDLEVTQCEV